MPTPTSRALVLAVSVTMIGVACTPTDPFEENPSCAMVCQRTAECLRSPEAEAPCFSQCTSAANGAGDLGQRVVDSCAACVEAVECGGVLSGECALDCPYGLFRGAGSGDGGVGGDGGRVEPRVRCDGLWTVDGTTYEMSCRDVGGDSADVICVCYRDGIRDTFFESNDACDVDDATRLQRAVTGCHWPLMQ